METVHGEKDRAEDDECVDGQVQDGTQLHFQADHYQRVPVG